MTRILTVKPGQEDYLDASYLLRQASPYENKVILFTNIEAQSNLLCNKRQLKTTSRTEQPKRVTLGNPDASERISEAAMSTLKIIDLLNLNSDALQKRERTYQIMQNFAKALWSVLNPKQNEKLKVAGSEIIILRENLRTEKERSIETDKELHNLRSCSTCSKENSAASTAVNVGENLESLVHLEGNTSCAIDEVCMCSVVVDHVISEYQRGINSSHIYNNSESEGAKILKILETAAEPEVSMAEMSPKQLTTFATYKSKLEVGLNERDVVPFMRVRVVGLTTRNYRGKGRPKEGIITIWNPIEKQVNLSSLSSHANEYLFSFENLGYLTHVSFRLVSEFDIAAYVVYVEKSIQPLIKRNSGCL
ncbi:hypothetical protein REPUB_Repub19eG0000200 [Reevesia pubescens]